MVGVVEGGGGARGGDDSHRLEERRGRVSLRTEEGAWMT